MIKSKYQCRSFPTVFIALITTITLWHIITWMNTVDQDINRTFITQKPHITDKWIEIRSIQGRIFLFSAYFDTRHRPVVRIVAVLLLQRTVPLYCHLVTVKSANSRGVTTVRGKLIAHKEAWKLNYSSFFVDCVVPRGFGKGEAMLVAVGESKSFDGGAAMLDVRRVEARETSKESFAACVKPMHSGYDRAAWLVEFVEFHRILGVVHFYLYDHSHGGEVDKILQLYKSMGIVTIIQWQIDLKSRIEIRTEAMFASFNDCLYRTMYRHSHTIFIDFDEIIVPKKAKNYREMLTAYENQKNIGSFVFKNTFFYLQHKNANLQTKSPHLLTLLNTRRTKEINKSGERSKYIAKPENCIMVGNHLVWIHYPGKRSLTVNPEIGLSHHYRLCEYDQCIESQTVFDNSTWRFAGKLIANVANICKLVYPESGKCPL